MKQTSTLTTRRHVRESISLSVELSICAEHRTQVKFSSSSSAREPHVVEGRAIDISSGGMGIACSQFLPRMCEGSVRIFDKTPIGTARDGTPIYDIAFEHRVKVRRVYLTGREPSYSLGVAFVDPEPDLARRITELKARLGITDEATEHTSEGAARNG